MQGSSRQRGVRWVTSAEVEHRRAEGALAQRENYFRSLIENALDLIAILDPDGMLLYVSPSHESTLGYRLDELIGRRAFDLVHPDDVTGVVTAFRSIARHGDKTTVEFRFRHKDGSWRSVEGIGKNLLNDPVVSGVVVNTRDITERLRAQDALRVSEDQYRLLFQSNPLPMWVFDAETLAFLAVNDAAVRHYGYSREEFLSMTVVDTRPPDTTTAYIAVLEQAPAPVAYFGRWMHCKKDGTRIDVDTTSSPIVFVGRPARLVAVQDVTEQLRVWEVEKNSRRQLLEAQEVGHLGSWELDLRTSALTWSDELYRLAGLEPNAPSITLATSWTLIHPDDRSRVQALIGEAIRHCTPFEYECRVHRADRTTGWFHVRGKVLTDDAGQPMRILGTVHDITERKLAAEEIQNSHRALRALSARLEAAREEEARRIAREIHDELGQALTALKLDLSWLANRLAKAGGCSQPFSAKLKAMTQVVDDSIGSMRRIATELRPRVLDALGLAAACEWQTHEFTERTGINCARTIRPVTVDDQRATALFRILQEALTNVVRHAHATLVTVSLCRRGADVILRVADNGRGVSDAEAHDGMGFGLLGMRERALVFGGTVRIRGARGRGTTITARIPVAPQGET